MLPIETYKVLINICRSFTTQLHNHYLHRPSSPLFAFLLDSLFSYTFLYSCHGVLGMLSFFFFFFTYPIFIFFCAHLKKAPLRITNMAQAIMQVLKTHTSTLIVSLFLKHKTTTQMEANVSDVLKKNIRKLMDKLPFENIMAPLTTLSPFEH